jgi:hypothetical protein
VGAVLELWAATYGRVAIVMALAAVLGYPLGRGSLRGRAALPLGLLLGLAALSLAVCLLSWLHLFYGASIAALGAIGALASGLCLWRDLPRWRAQRLRRQLRWPPATRLVPYAALLAVLLVFSALPIYPTTAFDATSYHLPLARQLVVEHGLRYDPFVRFSFFPQAGESVFAVMLLLARSPVDSGALEYAVLALGAMSLPGWFAGSGRRAGAGYVAAIALLASPVVIWVGTVAFIDAWTMVFVLAGLLCGLDAARQPDVRGRALPLMGAFLGVAAASKYTGLAFGLCVTVGVLVAGGARRRLWPWLGAALIAFLLFAGPWYAWTIHVAADPVYPEATGLFGNPSGLWNRAEIALQQSVQRAAPRPGIGGILARDLQYLQGEVAYNSGPGRSPLSWFLGLAFVALLLPSARRDRLFWGALLAWLGSLAVWIDASADPRFLVPALGLAAVAIGLASEQPLAWLERRAQVLRLRPPITATLGAVIALGGLWSWAGYARYYYDTGPPPTAAGAIGRFLAPRVGCYSAVAYLNHRLGSRYRAWGFACEQAHYYADGLLIGDAFSVGARDRIFDDGGAVMPRPSVLAARLEPLRVGWVILPAGPPSQPAELQRSNRFRLITSAGGQDVYRLAR